MLYVYKCVHAFQLVQFCNAAIQKQFHFVNQRFYFLFLSFCKTLLLRMSVIADSKSVVGKRAHAALREAESME